MIQKADLLLYGGTVVTMNETYELLSNGAVAIQNDTIVAVGTTDEILEAFEADEQIDCGGKVIMPGLINAHTHIPMTLLRGLNDDLRLDVWLGYLMPLEREFVTPEFVKLGTQIACAEMIRSGTTSFADMYYFEEAIAEETAVIGMRALLGQTILVFPTPDSATYEDALLRCRRFIEEWNGHPLIQPAVAPHAWYTATPELLQACADLAKEFDVPIHTHISETGGEESNCQEQHHMPVVAWNEQNNILETKLLAAHCVHLDEGEMFALKQANAGVAHCPTSNLKLSSGIANVGRMVELGLNVGVGTDGPASNNDLDMFEEMRLAALLAKAKSGDPTVLPARQALELATIGGARAMHMADITGSLEIGKRADIAVVEMDGIHNQPQFSNNPDAIYSRLIYAAKSNDVAHVIVNGRWLMRNRVLLTVDEARAKADGAKVAIKIDEFVMKRESNPYNKLVLLAGVERQESFEVQVKVPVANKQTIINTLKGRDIEIVRTSHYRQYDHYFTFEDIDQDAARLRHREDEFIDDKGNVYQTRSRLTLLGAEDRQAFDNAVMLSRSRYIAPADRSLRFYREYFAPEAQIEVVKERLRWHLLYKETAFELNLDALTMPKLSGFYLEIKSRTWSRTDATRKANLIVELLTTFGVDLKDIERRDYADFT